MEVRWVTPEYKSPLGEFNLARTDLERRRYAAQIRRLLERGRDAPTYLAGAGFGAPRDKRLSLCIKIAFYP